MWFSSSHSPLHISPVTLTIWRGNQLSQETELPMDQTSSLLGHIVVGLFCFIQNSNHFPIFLLLVEGKEVSCFVFFFFFLKSRMSHLGGPVHQIKVWGPEWLVRINLCRHAWIRGHTPDENRTCAKYQVEGSLTNYAPLCIFWLEWSWSLYKFKVFYFYF